MIVRITSVKNWHQTIVNKGYTMRENLEIRQQIIDAAIDLHINNGGNFTLKQLCQKAKIKQGEFYQQFNSKNQVLGQFYPLCVQRCREMSLQIEAYHSMSLAEKLGNFIYMMFDLLQEQREFVDETFGEMVFLNAGTAFHREVADVIGEILENDPQIPDLQRSFLLNAQMYDVLAKEYIHLLKFWLSDDSPNFEKSMALTDKLVNFLEEVLHSNVIGHAADLLKFFVQNDVIKLNIPLIKWLIQR